MSGSELRVERLLSRLVRDRDGKVVGPIEEVRVEERDGTTHVVEYRVGAYGFLQRLAGSPMRQSLLRLLGRAQKAGPYAVPWDQMDLTDPRRPRLRCEVATLRRVGVTRGG